ncbi:NAD(P)-dependent oxidoreductase [Flavobacterium xinjiangense]|uniref:D-3-phosphoglycerate dehydrogenase n=1 Tax=Flavobacterium xinjiangense TaxID=178356 RepID=A0A1M7MWJ8_9FLAO|nr:NAD(P)-dependent oxidoreductase [Flavobacterium xinjiangense]SHM95543.1 D-3-phosphoglycerate dehydrogenase [Flavobacterium xinjiangense]
MKILITESNDFSPKALLALRNQFEVKTVNVQSKQELIAMISDFEVLFVRLGFSIDIEIIQKAKKLKYILTATTGLDHVDVIYFESIGGKVISLKNQTAFLGTIPSTAEHTWALLLSLIKKIPSSFHHVKNGEWDRNLFINSNLKEKKIGILGLGRVGNQVAKFARVFDMEVGFFDTVSIKSQFKKFETPEELCKWADIVSIHIPYTVENKNFVNKELLSHFKRHSVLINTSRGGIWDEKEVAILIENGVLTGVATDVLKNELDPDSIAVNPLVLLANQNYNVIITPHIAGATKESMAMTEEFIVEIFLKGLI